MGQFDAFAQTLGTFLQHFKSSSIKFEDCRGRATDSADASRELAFLENFEPVMELFRSYDPSWQAHVREGRYSSPDCHLLIDEFQDMSDGRAQLILALEAQHADTRMFAFGDDWQSIYPVCGLGHSSYAELRTDAFDLRMSEQKLDNSKASGSP